MKTLSVRQAARNAREDAIAEIALGRFVCPTCLDVRDHSADEPSECLAKLPEPDEDGERYAQPTGYVLIDGETVEAPHRHYRKRTSTVQRKAFRAGAVAQAEANIAVAKLFRVDPNDL